MTPAQVQALQELAAELAADICRLRRVYGLNESAPRFAFAVDRLAGHAWALFGFVQPTASVLYRETGDVGWALEVVDDHARRFARLLGEKVER